MLASSLRSSAASSTHEDTYITTRSATKIVPTDMKVSVAIGMRIMAMNCAYQYGHLGSHNAKMKDVPLYVNLNLLTSSPY